MKNNESEQFNNKEEFIPSSLPIPLTDGIEEIKQSLKFRSEKGDVTYGIEILDDACGFIPPGTVTLIMACPNVGKSLCAQQIANNIAKQGHKVLICSCEMSAGQLMLRELKRTMGVSNKQLLEGYKKNPSSIINILDKYIDDDQFKYLENIQVLDIGDMYIDELIKILNMDDYKKYRYIIVDYVQRLKGVGDTEYNQFKDISQKLHTFAMRTRRCIIECSQIPKTNENDSRTQKNGINFQTLRAKGAGNFEEDADIAIKMAEELEGNELYVLINLSKNRCDGLKCVTYKYQKTPRLEFKLISKGY